MTTLRIHRATHSSARIVSALAVVAALATARADATPTFTNVTAAAGITHNPFPPNCPECTPTFAEEQSGGAAAGDFDGDGWVDLYVTRYFDTDILYRNNRDGTFANVTATAFPEGIDTHRTNGAAWGDVDNDGDLDLAVATLQEPRHLLYINDGAGRFSEQGSERGVLIAGGLPTTSGTSFSMGDYDRDGYLDMYVAEWRGFSTTSSPAQARLFHNRGAEAPGRFEDVTAAVGVGMDVRLGPFVGKALAFTPRFSDLDRDGLTDIAVAADAGTTRLFWNDPTGVFLNRTAAAGIATGTNDMGLTLGDFNGDGLLDWFVTSIGTGSGAAPSGNRLFLNNGNRTFTDVTQATGVREGGWGWAAEALDYDNDGDLDVVHTNGMGVAPVDQTVLFKNIGNRTSPEFVNAAREAGIVDNNLGRGLLTLDYDRDGDLDVFIVNFNAPPVLYRNDGGNSNNWLEIDTIGLQSNRDGVGAYITVTPDLDQPEVAYVAEVDASSNYLAQSAKTAHFGLGAANVVDQIVVQWPSGCRQTFVDVAANQLLTISEGLLADFNGDDRVDAEDLATWRAGYGTTADGPQTGDANRDGVVDGRDFLLWQRQAGRVVTSGLSTVSSARVPEPAAWSLSVLATACCAGLVRRGRFRNIRPAPARCGGGRRLPRRL